MGNNFSRSDTGVGRGRDRVEGWVQGLEVSILREVSSRFVELALALSLESHLGGAHSRLVLQEVILVDGF